MHRCRQITPDHIRILRQALGVNCCPTPCANYYVAGAEEFDLLEAMVRMGLMTGQNEQLPMNPSYKARPF